MHAHTSYNILIGRPSLNTLGAIVSTPHLTMKFPSNTRSIITVHADQKTIRECYMTSLKLSPLTNDETCWVVHYVAGVERSEELDMNPRTNDNNKVKLIKETCTFQLDIKEEHVTQLDNELSMEDKSNVQVI